LPVNGHPLQVLESLKPFVEFIQTRNGTRNSWWWIDYIYINEFDLLERGSQVQMMRQIYCQSKQTVVWLGPKSDENDRAICFLHLICRKQFKFASVARKDEKEQSRLMAEALVREDTREDWAALEKFFLHPWFTRVWTLQEFILSRDVAFYCGSKTLSRKVLDSAVFGVWQWFNHKEGGKTHDSGPLPLLAMISYFSDHNATNHHNRIYSLSGLAVDSKKLVPVTRYDISTCEAYIEFARNFVQEYNSLDIICFSNTFNHLADSTLPSDLPSWVPVWRAKQVPLVAALIA
jgi:Heterokaryon incompatibility protein (HET)